jgi:hypothetical protein
MTWQSLANHTYEKFRDTTMKFFVIVDLESKILILMKLDEIISLILMKTK